MIRQVENFETENSGFKYANVIDHRHSKFEVEAIDSNDDNPVVITVLKNGMILDCNEATSELLGWESKRLRWLPISKIMPQLADISLFKDKIVNPSLRVLSEDKHRFDLMSANGVRIACEVFFHVIDKFDNCCLKITLYPCRRL